MEIKDRIIEVSSALFIKTGIKALTMGEIAKEMGISKRTLYEHYANKESLLKACLEFWEKENDRVEKEINESSTNPVDLVHKHFEYAVAILLNVNPAFFGDLKKHYSALWKCQYKEMQQKRNNLIIQFFDFGIQEGYFRPSVQREIAAKLFYAQVELLHDNNVFAPNMFSKADVFAEIIVIFLRGICTEKGLNEVNRLFKNSNN